ncbi:MAG: DUF5107 domain-containing protein, partial [Armatimonadetes bacterium]|nr:DUF5107 domain-containing protein [Armatimonadota bacterium]
LPELGGRIYSAVDKATGEDVFYRNNVVKPGLIALRGAWISGGVEWNFPQGHTVTTVSRVDARMVEEEDGSAAIWVGNIEQIHRMSWSVGIRLRPGSGAIETEIHLANRTSLPHPYYFWANAAVPAADDLRLVYPGTRVRTWGSTFDWPVNEGKDLARYTAFERANDVFLIDSLEDFFGVYYEERDFGLVHVADVHDSFGKKFFTWGTANHGRVWSAALSDSDGPYCEVQSGRYVDQTTWRLMPPHWTERWTEWWYPVQRMGALSWANKEAAVGLARRGGGIECGLIVTRPVPGARVLLAAGDTVLEEERLDLVPGRPLRMKVPQADPTRPATVCLWDGQGREIIRYAEGQRPRTIRIREEPQTRDSSPGELLRRAARAEEQADPDAAWDLYERALMVDPACEEAALALGRLAIEHKPGQALARLEGAAAALRSSPAAAYCMGVALARAGRDPEAETELWRAAQRPEYAHAARVELGQLLMRRGDWREAAEVLRVSLDYGPADTRTRVLLAAARRKEGRVKEALAALDEARRQSPADRLALAEMHFCMVEMERPRLAARCLRELSELMPAESDPWLELALDCLAAGLPDEAVELLTWASGRIPAVRDCPLSHYLLGHLLHRLGRKAEAKSARRKAGELPADLVFPHHWELEAVLREALEDDPHHGRARRYLGDLLYSQGRREEALVEWRAAAESGEHASVVHRNLALAYQRVEGDLQRAEEELRAAIEIGPFDRRLYLELNEVLLQRRAPADVRLAALDSAPDSLQRQGAIAAQQAACCIVVEQWDRAIELLTTHTFHRWEMEFRMRGVYVDAYLGRGTARFDRGDLPGARADFEKALEYPMNLRIGRPAKPSDARAHWCAAVVCEALGDRPEARVHWEAAAAETHHHPGKELAVYQALGLQKLGRTEEAQALLSEALDIARQVADTAPEDAGAQFSLGLTLKAMGAERLLRLEAEGVEALRRALELDSTMARAKRLLGSKV